MFGSPSRLNLRLCCIPRTRSRQPLDIWPALPLFIRGDVSDASVDNVVAELEHSDRICQISLSCLTISHIEKLCMAMQVPFPELAFLHLSGSHELLSDSFLGGSAPCLRSLYLIGIPFPGMPKLLLSSTRLVHLHLEYIPHSGFISPEVMATCLSMLTSLELLQLELETRLSRRSYPDQESQHSPPPIRAILPALLSFSFGGVNEYLEDLLSRIDAPRLYRLSITYFWGIRFDTPELNQFISRTPIFGPYDEARLIVENCNGLVRLQSYLQPSDHGMVEIKIRSPGSNREVSSLARICTSSLRHLLTMETLYIHEDYYSKSSLKDDIGNPFWLDLLLAFTTVRYLYLSKASALCIAPVLQELTVLPTLQNIFLEGFQPSEPVHDGIRQFIFARQLIDRPIAISAWERYAKCETIWEVYY